jgi:hypothetical protein
MLDLQLIIDVLAANDVIHFLNRPLFQIAMYGLKLFTVHVWRRRLHGHDSEHR